METKANLSGTDDEGEARETKRRRPPPMDDDDLEDLSLEKRGAVAAVAWGRKIEKKAGVVKKRAEAAERDPEDAMKRFYKDMLSQAEQRLGEGTTPRASSAAPGGR